MFTALVMMVRFWKLRSARAIAVVVVPESRISTWPSFTSRGCAFRDAQFLLMVELFFLPQRRIFKRAFARRQSSSVGAMDQAMRVQDFEILANRNLRGFELPGEFRN